MTALDSGGGDDGSDDQESRDTRRTADEEAVQQLSDADQGGSASSGGGRSMANGVTSGGGETARSGGSMGPREQADEQLTRRDPGSGDTGGGAQDRGRGVTSGSGDTAQTAPEDRDASQQDTAAGRGGGGASRAARSARGVTSGGGEVAASAEAAEAARQREQDVADVERQVAGEQVDATLEEGIEGRGGQRAEVARRLEQRVIEEDDRVDSPDGVVIVEEDGELVAKLSRSAQVEEVAESLDLDDQVLRSIQSDQRPSGTGLDPGEATGIEADVIGRGDLEFEFQDGEVDVQVSEEAQGEIAAARVDEDAIQRQLREDVASESPDIEPGDVQVVREGQRFVASAEVETVVETREEQLLPSVDVDLREREINVEGGDLSAIPDVTPARVFGTVGGLEEEEIEELETRAERVDEETQGAPPVGLGGGRALPIRGIAAGGALVSGGVLASEASQSTAGDAETQVATTEQVTRTAEVGVGDAVIDSEIDVGGVTPTSEIEVGRAPSEVDELEPSGTAGVTPTTVEPGGTATETRIELPTGDESTDTPQETGGESVVPGEFPLAGRDFPLDPSQERQRQTRPEDIISTGAEAAPVQEQISPEEVIVDEELQRRRRSRDPELEEILRGPPEEVVIGGEPITGFPSQRGFPTGASAVVGRETAMASEAVQLEVLEQTESPAEQFEAPGPAEAGLPAVGAMEDALTGTDVTTDVAARQATAQAQQVGVQQESVLAEAMGAQTAQVTEQAFEMQTEPVFEEGFGEAAAAGLGDALPELDSGGRRDRRDSQGGFFRREFLAPVEENPLSAIDEDLKNL